MQIAHLTKAIIKPFISPQQYDFWAREIGSTSAWERCFARVLHRSNEAEDTITLVLRPNANFATYRAGQHVNLSAMIRGRRITRSYSFTSIPSSGRDITITVRRDRHGLMSEWLYQQAEKGTILELGAVFGDMALPQRSSTGESSVLLLAAGSGITPLMSLIREMVGKGFGQPTTLLYWDRTAKHFCFSAELQRLSEQYKQFSVHFISSRDAGSGPSMCGRISAQQLDTLLGDQNIGHAFVCGGADFVDAAKSLLRDRVTYFHTEAFSPPRRSIEETAARAVNIELQMSGRNVTVSNHQTVLEALEEQGVSVASGCRMGICNTCSCTKISGSTQDINNGVNHHETDSAIKLCVSRASTDLQLAL